MSNICLTKEQADYGSSLGITCDQVATVVDGPPYDITCIFAGFKSPTENGCLAAVDSDGASCEWCSLPGYVPTDFDF
jgi:hypothetical protein